MNNEQNMQNNLVSSIPHQNIINVDPDENKKDDYNADCNFMIDCLQLFLTMKAENQVCQPPLMNYEKRIHHQLLGDALLEYYDEYFLYQGNCDKPILKSEAFAALRKFADNKNAPTTMIRFKKTLIEYCKYRGFIFNPSELCTTKDNRIIKVYRVTDQHDMTTMNAIDDKYLIWKEEVKEVTMADLEEHFGCKVKVVK